ncbi:hypothetical protein ACMD2_09653 [Ananas comosus]|uniref:Protein CYCLOPS-like n=1 Tax=Ananas comosus TaxID=4615 RepID=A0A199VVL7_ANACO|nr:hypothetical protein ACMD2_09653 [Ananas comosus]
MEMEGSFSDLFRNSTEEMFLKSVMENPIGASAPTSVEMLGFREDSEKLFNSWLMSAEIPGYNSATHRTRQPSRRISAELAALSSQQNGLAQKKTFDENLPQQNFDASDELSNNFTQQSLRNAAEIGMQASNLYLAKAWFHSTQPMTRSRSSELRRRYAAMQSIQVPATTEIQNNNQGQGNNFTKNDLTNTNNPCEISMVEMPTTFMSPSNSSTSPFDAPLVTTNDTVSSVVSMLKDTLERKKLGNYTERENSRANPFAFYAAQQVQANNNSFLGTQCTFQLPKFERTVEANTENFVTPQNQMWVGAVSREPSQSGSSNAGFDACDGTSYSAQAVSASCESTRKNIITGFSDSGSKTNESRGRIFKESLHNDRKNGNLSRMGSIQSESSAEKGDPTKKRRVERSRKMAEAKERNLTPTVPSDMQAVLKRCENLEKEVRSLKLNLSFMNRKDSEQTKQIEELQKQNEELMDEKERLLEEIERIISETSSR